MTRSPRLAADSGPSLTRVAGGPGASLSGSAAGPGRDTTVALAALARSPGPGRRRAFRVQVTPSSSGHRHGHARPRPGQSGEARSESARSESWSVATCTGTGRPRSPYTGRLAVTRPTVRAGPAPGVTVTVPGPAEPRRRHRPQLPPARVTAQVALPGTGGALAVTQAQRLLGLRAPGRATEPPQAQAARPGRPTRRVAATSDPTGPARAGPESEFT
jgi:hypothetical protein